MKSYLSKSTLPHPHMLDSPSMSLSFLAAVLCLRLASNCFHLKESFWKSLKGLGIPGPMYSPMSALFHWSTILSSLFMYLDWNALFLNISNFSSSFCFFWSIFFFFSISFFIFFFFFCFTFFGFFFFLFF